MTSLQNDDFAFDFDSNEDDDVDGWGDDDDLEIIDDDRIMMQLSRKNSMDREENTCWKCKQCEMINNVRLSIEKENMKCCGCSNTLYIPDETKTFQCSKWNNHNDYLLKIGILKQIKVWICNLCTFQNKNIDAEYCEICESLKTSKNIIQTITIPSNDIKIASISCKTITTTNKDEINSSDSDSNIDDVWKCPNCNLLNKNNKNNKNSKCNVCECHRPIKFNNINLSEIITFGYIRQFIDSSNLNIPTVINRLCQQYYTKYDLFQYQCIYDQTGKLLYTKKFEQSISIFTCHGGGYMHNLFGTNIVKGPSIFKPVITLNGGISRWRIRLSLNEKIYDENNNDESMREKVKFYGVAVGIIRDDGRINKSNPFSYGQKGNMFVDRAFAFGIHGNGKYHRYEQFCRGFRENDVIVVELNANKRTVSYGINDDWFGVAFENVKSGYYRLGICVKQRGVMVKCVEFVGESLDEHHVKEISDKKKKIEGVQLLQ